jgi:hypothetical protein
LADDVAELLPRGRAYVADPHQRAGTSILLDVAERTAGRELLIRIVAMLTLMVPSRKSGTGTGSGTKGNREHIPDLTSSNKNGSG